LNWIVILVTHSFRLWLGEWPEILIYTFASFEILLAQYYNVMGNEKDYEPPPAATRHRSPVTSRREQVSIPIPIQRHWTFHITSLEFIELGELEEFSTAVVLPETVPHPSSAQYRIGVQENKSK